MGLLRPEFKTFSIFWKLLHGAPFKIARILRTNARARGRGIICKVIRRAGSLARSSSRRVILRTGENASCMDRRLCVDLCWYFDHSSGFICFSGNPLKLGASDALCFKLRNCWKKLFQEFLRRNLSVMGLMKPECMLSLPSAYSPNCCHCHLVVQNIQIGTWKNFWNKHWQVPKVNYE